MNLHKTDYTAVVSITKKQFLAGQVFTVRGKDLDYLQGLYIFRLAATSDNRYHIECQPTETFLKDRWESNCNYDQLHNYAYGGGPFNKPYRVRLKFQK